MTKLLIRYLIAFLLSGLAVADERYLMAVTAEDGPAKTLKRWQPTVDLLTRSIAGAEFVLQPVNYGDSIVESDPDLVLTDPGVWQGLSSSDRFKPLATVVHQPGDSEGNSLGSVIFTYIKHDEIYTLADLNGRRFVAVSPESLGGWLAAVKEMEEYKITPDTDFSELTFVGRGDYAVLAVLAGDVDAGCVSTGTLERMAAIGDIERSEFRILNQILTTNHDYAGPLSTPLYPGWVLAAKSALPEDRLQSIKDILREQASESPSIIAADIKGWQ